MKKILALSMILLLAGSAYATQAERTSLGVPSWMLEKDDTNIFFSAPQVLNHTNKAIGELNTNVANDGNAGVLIKAKDKLAIGVWVKRAYAGNLGAIGEEPGGIVLPADNDATWDDVSANVLEGVFGTQNLNVAPLAPVGKYDVLAAYEVNENIKVGVRVSQASDSASGEPVMGQVTNPKAVTDGSQTQTLKSSEMQIAPGVLIEGIVPMIDCVEANISYGTLSVDNSDSIIADNAIAGSKTETITLATDSPSQMGIDIRAIKTINDTTKAIIDINTASEKTDNIYTHVQSPVAGVNTIDSIQTTTEKRGNMSIGAALNISPNEDTLIIVGASYVTNKVQYTGVRKDLTLATNQITDQYDKLDQTTTTIPLNIAVKKRLGSVVSLLAGYSPNISNKQVQEMTDPDANSANGVTGGFIDTAKNTTDMTAANATTTIGLSFDLSDDTTLIIQTNENLWLGPVDTTGAGSNIAANASLVTTW